MRSRVILVGSDNQHKVVASVSAGGDARITAVEKTEDAVYIAGSAAGTPFLKKVPATEYASSP